MSDNGSIGEQERQGSAPAKAPAVNTTLSILALVFGIIMAPLGLILAIVDLVKARRSNRKSSPLAVVGAVVGGLGTIGAIAGTIAIVVLLGSLQSTSQFDAMCGRAAADQEVFAESTTFLETLPLPSEMTADDATALASEAASLSSRLRAIPGNVGTAYPRVMTAGHIAGDRLSEIETYLTDLAAGGFSTPISTIEAKSDVSYFENEVLTTCP